MRQIRDFRSNFENIHDFPANVTYFHLNSYDRRATFVRVSPTFVRMSLSFIFSPDSREVFARLSRDTHVTFVRVSRKFRIVNSPKFRSDKFATLARQSCEIFWRKNSHKIFQHVEKLRDQFATSSRHKKILPTLARHLHECRAKVRDKNRKTVARNLHASEILA